MNWQGVLKQKDVKQTDVKQMDIKQGLCVLQWVKVEFFRVTCLRGLSGGFGFTHSLPWCWMEVSVQHEDSAAVPLVSSD